MYVDAEGEAQKVQSFSRAADFMARERLTTPQWRCVSHHRNSADTAGLSHYTIFTGVSAMN